MMQLIDMNNMAVYALQQGRPNKSLTLLSTALAIVKDHFANERQQELVRESTMSTPVTTPVTTETPSLEGQIPSCISDSSFSTEAGLSDCEFAGERSFAVDNEENEESLVPSIRSVTGGIVSSHNDGLILNYNKALVVLHSLDDLDVLTSIVLYNIALVKHGRAMTKGSSTLLTAALALYKQSTQIIKNKPVVDKASDFVLLVTYHNMAHIYASQFYPEEMRVCFDAARHLLAQALTQRLLDGDDIEFFSMSALLEVADIRLAPAA
jgi:hypothetical protein